MTIFVSQTSLAIHPKLYAFQVKHHSTTSRPPRVILGRMEKYQYINLTLQLVIVCRHEKITSVDIRQECAKSYVSGGYQLE